MSRANQLRQSIEAALANPGRVLTRRAGPEPPAGVHNSTCVHDQLVVKQEKDEEGGGMRPKQEVYLKQAAFVKQEPEEVKQEAGEEEVHMGSKERVGGAQARRPGFDAANQNLSLDDLRPHFFKSREDAALCLRVSINSLKAACKRNGVDRWPFRKLVSLVNLTEAMRGKASEQEQAEMQAELCKVVENTNHEVNENLVKLKLLNYKERYRLRTKGGTQPIYQRRSISKQRSGKNCGGISMKRTRRKCQQSSPSSSSQLSADLSPRDPLTRASSLNAPGLHTHDEGTHAATHLFASTPDSGSQERGSGAWGGSYSGIDAMAYITSGSCGADMRSKGGSACHKQHQEQQQEYLQQQQEQQQPMHCRLQLGPTPPELSSRRSSATLMQPIDSLMHVPRSSRQQVLEREGFVLDSCLPLPMLPATTAHAQPHHLQPTGSVGGLVTAEQLHPHPDRRAPAPLGTTPSARSSSTHIVADPAPPPPLQLQQLTAHRLAAPWQQLQLQQSWSGSGSGSPAPQQNPPHTTRSRASFDIGASFGGMTDCHGTDTSAQPRASLDIRAAFGGGMEYRSTTGSTSPYDDGTGSSMVSGFARPAAQMAAAMRVEGFSKPQPQPPPLGKTNVHLFNEPVATYNAFQTQQQQQPLSHTLLRTQPAVKAPQVKAQQLQHRHPHAPPVQRPWTDHTTRNSVDDTQQAPDAAGTHPLALPAVSEEETTRACAEAGRGDTQEMLPALASMLGLPSSRGLASVEYHYNDNAADTHAHSGEGDVLVASLSQPRPGLPSQRLEQQQPPYVPQQQQHLQGQQLPQIKFGTHSLQYELHSSSDVQIDPSMFLLQDDKEEGAPDNMPSMMSMPSMGPISAVRVKEEGTMSRDCSMPNVMPTSVAQFTARLPDVRVALPPSVPMDRFQSLSFPGNTPSLQNLADLSNEHHQQQQQQQRRQRGEEQPQRLDDLLDALDGFQEPPGLSDFNSAPLPRLPSFDHDMDDYFDVVVHSGMW